MRVAQGPTGIGGQQQVQLADIAHQLIGRQARRQLAQVFVAFRTLQARLLVGVEPVGQGLRQAFGGHVGAQQLHQLALRTLGLGANQCIDVETAVQVANSNARLAALEVIAQGLPAQGLPEQRAGAP